MTASQIQLGDITFANNHPFVLLGGVNVLEDLDFALHCADHYKQVCERLGIPRCQEGPCTLPGRSKNEPGRSPGPSGIARPLLLGPKAAPGGVQDTSGPHVEVIWGPPGDNFGMHFNAQS